MRGYLSVSIMLLWCLVEVQPQSPYPYVSFLGETLPNHAYVDLSLVGINQDGSDSVQCHTNVRTCCRSSEGLHRGDWFPPGSNMKLPFPALKDFVFEDREAQRVDLRQRNASSPTGIFRCTVYVRVEGEENPVQRSAFVGLYLGDGGNVRISGGVTLTVISDLNGPSPQFSLTCNSTGGPATTVTWTRDDVTFTRGTETVLIDLVTAQYTHTLTVSGRPEGLYTCTVSNSKPSQDSVQLNTQASFEEFVIVDSSATSLTFSWTLTPIASLLITGYNITCIPLMEGIPLPEPLVGEQKDTSATVTGLHPGVSYTCVAVTFSPWQISPPQNITYSTSEIAPSGSPEAFEAAVGQRQVVFTWSPPPVTQRNGVITSYTLSCSPSPSSLPQSPSSQSRSLTATGFSPNTLYSCSLAANNSQGSGPPSIRTFITLEDFSHIQLQLGGVTSCPEFTSSSTDEKLSDITDAVMDTLTTSCPNCAIASSRIDQQSFTCDSESPTYVTYRARLEGTSETDSGSLIPLIEAWARTGPNITAGGEKLTVSQETLVSPLPTPNPDEVTGSLRIIGDISLAVISDLNGPSPQFTLTCISTGGPATTVTWTRDSTTVTQGTETVLNDPVTAQYTHTLTVSGRPEGLYTCTVSNSKPSQDSVQLKIDGLAGVPEEFEAEAGQRQVVFTWSPPPATQHSGSITNYTLSCSPSPSSLPQSPSSQSGSLTATGFSPNTLYSCSLTANNNRGTGPQAMTSFTTLEDYVLFQLHFTGIPSTCKGFEETNGPEKLDNITSTVLDVLSESCANCAIDEEYFACDSESPTYVTYRARLEGTSETDSGSLIPLIEAWARTGPHITAGGLLTVNPECPVSISDHNEGQCQSPTSDSNKSFFTLQNIIIIAGVGGGALLLIVIVSITILCCCCCCRHKKSFTLKNIEIVHSTGEKNTDEEAEDFEKVNMDDKHPTPPLAEDEKHESEPRDPQDTDERETVNENIC